MLGRVSHIEPELDAGADAVDSFACPERATTLVSRALLGAEGRVGAGSTGRAAARDAVVGAFETADSRLTGGASGRAGFVGSGAMTPSDSVTGFAGESGETGESAPDSRESLD
jgi:hypothetical protein